MQKLHEILLTFFYCGKAKKAPGTVGSAASVLAWLIITYVFSLCGIPIFWQNVAWGMEVLGALIYGTWAIPIYVQNLATLNGKNSEIDHKSIVLDEYVGQVLALQITFTPLRQNYFADGNLIIAHLLVCFILFRLFDITKPLFIGYADRKFKSGFGVMFDDVLAGLVAAALGLILIFYFL